MAAGCYTVQQKGNSRYTDAHPSSDNDFSVVTREAQGDDSQKWCLTTVGDGYHTIQHKLNNRYMDAYTTSSDDYSVITREAQGDDSQEWLLTAVGDGYYTVQHKQNGRYLDAELVDAYNAVTREAQGDDSQKWLIQSEHLSCSQNALSNFSSLATMKDAMESTGWSFSFDNADGTALAAPSCGGGSNWYGWSDDNAVGTLTSPSLEGSGTATIEYGNCWNAGNVKLYLNDTLIDTAAPNSPTRSKVFSFANGDIVKLKDEDGNAIVNLKAFTISCALTSFVCLSS